MSFAPKEATLVSVSAKIRAIHAGKNAAEQKRLTDEANDELLALFEKMKVGTPAPVSAAAAGAGAGAAASPAKKKKKEAGEGSDLCGCQGNDLSPFCCQTKSCGCHKQGRSCLPQCGCQINKKTCNNPKGVDESEQQE